MTEKGIGSKLLGLFVETEGKADEAPEPAEGQSAADLVAELAKGAGAPPGAPPARPAAAPARPPPDLKLDPAAAPAGSPTDFDAIFREAGMDGAELDRVKKAEELLKALPEGTPRDVKRQIVEASLKAFGFEVEKIVSAADNQKRALDAYVKVNEGATAKGIQDAQAQIQGLEQKIAALRAEIDKRTAGLGALSKAASARKEQVQRVLDFFVPPAGTP